MEVLENPMTGLFLLKPRVFEDDRGYFFESWQKERLEKAIGSSVNFVQDNESMSTANVLRGMHFQKPPHAQAKLVRVVRGEVLDVVVDIRKNSGSYGQHYSARLSEENKHQMFIPEGFAHGFLTLRENTIFTYKCTDYYHPETEDSLLWNDDELGIKWPIDDPLVSEKDLKASEFRSFVTPF